MHLPGSHMNILRLAHLRSNTSSYRSTSVGFGGGFWPPGLILTMAADISGRFAVRGIGTISSGMLSRACCRRAFRKRHGCA
jgi:hypothetical protein